MQWSDSWKCVHVEGRTLFRLRALIGWWWYRCLFFDDCRHHKLISLTRELASPRVSLPYSAKYEPVLLSIEELFGGLGNALMLLKADKPICIRWDKTIREALQLMVANDFSQLPIVDSQGKLFGIISEQSIVRKYRLINGNTSLLDLTVDHCQVLAVTLPLSEDLFKALDLLKNVYAIVIVDNGEPCGILTDYDTTHFFREIAGGCFW